MLLKCRYLAQFSVAELSKNAANISKASEQCPFMMHAKRTLATNSGLGDASAAPFRQDSSIAKSENAAESSSMFDAKQQAHYHESQHQRKMECTNTINCPFFKNGSLELKKILTEKKLDDLNEIDQITESKFMKSSTKRNSSTSSTGAKRQHVERESASPSEDKENKLFDYDHFFGQKIEDKKRDGSYRYFKKVVRQAARFPIVLEQTNSSEAAKERTIWCSNDYLGLGTHPYVKSKVMEAVEKYGAGSGGTRNISGSTPLHDKLERELARLHQKEAALLFTSCYVANDTTLYTMSKMLPNCHILSDSGNHASMIQGIRNSGMPKTIFRHNDTEHLEQLLKQLPVTTPKIVAFESVHSMDGSICDLEKMCDITHKYGGIAYIDEVHAVGLYGENGAGVGERDGMLHKMDIITGTLGKAFGNIGGYIAGSSRFVDTMRSYCSGFIFTTSLPPSVVSGALAAVELSRSDEGRELRARHQKYARIVKQKLIEAGLPVMNSPSHIVPVMVGNVQYAGEICDRLLNEHGIYIQSINYPTVPRGEERLRIVPNPHHSLEMIEKLVDSLVDIWQKTGLKLVKSQKTESI